MLAAERGGCKRMPPDAELIYLDNAATSWPKAPGVAEAMTACLASPLGGPGRGSHPAALAAGRLIRDCRRAVASLLGLGDPLRLSFTPSTTVALNVALKGWLRPGDEAVVSPVEHNAVMRPLHALAVRGVTVRVAEPTAEGGVEARAMARLITGKTRLLVAARASNVTGAMLPMEELAELGQRHGIPLLVDTAQTAGREPLGGLARVSLLAFPGHKALLGPMGTGGLWVPPGLSLSPLWEGGTGSQSEAEAQPLDLPDSLEAGTPNVVGLAGLGAAVAFLETEGIAALAQRERLLTARLHAGLASIEGVHVYGPPLGEPRAALVSFNVGEMDSAAVAHLLDRSAHIAVRGGLHCAPAAHRVLGTLARGAVRASPGPFTTEADVERLLEAVCALSQEA
ncbi:MAG: aminotransferase class V-fold PLP-dependent enzyme [Bacillota bacterium]